ncbi:MAG TPA: hypothetical protein VM899_16995, partial [Rubellimicrobium sp.]|nr:hypothetical protein [Rubellimicrobium sp.]
MVKASDLRVLLGALAGVGLGGVALLTVVPVMAPTTDSPGPVARNLAPDAGPPKDAGAPTDAGPADPVVAPAPSFDTVRVAPDGSGLVAGEAVPGATVAVLAGEVVAAEATADADGRFVAFLELAPSAEPRALSLRDGSGGVSEETVIVAPTGETSIQGAREVAEAGPSRGASEGVGGEAPGAASTRELPLDRPAPDLALADEPDAGHAASGGAEASSEMAMAADLSAGEAAPDPEQGVGTPAPDGATVLAMDAAGADGDASAPLPDGPAPEVVATGPAGGVAPGEGDGTTEGLAAGDLAPP